ncbi:flagellar protein FlaG [Larsenimonas salina]|uniref:flagellar protein FlaG n=1 Tax=Larsenimonas salina TaxID=1295565 RepID=UPI002072F5DA|nr:flagellar protein FlaG [Larsenimonas salina]MCM5703707.1 flagellar protein FlaG [Larsenimonas salina]
MSLPITHAHATPLSTESQLPVPQASSEGVLARASPSDLELPQTTASPERPPLDQTELDSYMQEYGVRFKLDQDIDRMVVHLIDKANGELIRQIPSEEMVGIITRLQEGSLQMIDTRA